MLFNIQIRDAEMGQTLQNGFALEIEVKHSSRQALFPCAPMRKQC